MAPTRPSTHHKAAQINRDAARHGTLAEIGAGQEVARWLFHVGGASATIAKSISAYDMVFSDAIYGPTDHYVSRRRLQAMLDTEYRLVVERLEHKLGATTCFFVFADTVATGIPARQQQGQGWMGIRFQHELRAAPSELMIHMQMHDTERVREQDALGVLGINLMYGAFYHREDPNALVGTLLDNLAPGRVQIDMIRFSGPAFEGVDNRLMSVRLVELGHTDAALFTAQGEVVQPAEVLFEKPALVLRGSFRPVTNTTMDMVTLARAQFIQALAKDSPAPVVLLEMTLRNLLYDGPSDPGDLLNRVNMLVPLGNSVVITNHAHHYPVSAWLRRYTHKPVVFAVGIPNLKELFDEKYYSALGGGILESFGRLFQEDTKLYVYPSKDPDSDSVLTLSSFGERIAPHLRHLLAYLVDNRMLLPIEKVDESQLHIQPEDVRARIRAGDPSWEKMVPARLVPLLRDSRNHGGM